MSQKKTKKNVTVDTKEFLVGIQALTIYYEHKCTEFETIKQQFGEGHAITQAVFEEVTNLGNIVSHLSNLVGGQVHGDTDSLN